jgi:hypothetical protein
MSKAVAAALAIVVVAVLVVLGFTLKHSVTGTETIQGTTTSMANNPTIPLTATGQVGATGGSLTLGGGGNGQVGYLRFKGGTLAVRHYNGLKAQQSQSFSQAACSFTQVSRGEFRIVPALSTGSFKGMSGRGTYQVTFSGKFALTAGKCVVTNSTNPVSGKIAFKATGVTAVRKAWL